jgi:hypothetical protein
MSLRFRFALIIAPWPILMGLAFRARMADAFDPSASAFGTNWPGDVAHVALFGAVEVAVLIAIMRPWSYRRSWGRAALAAILFAAYGLFTLLVGMHAGSILGIHALWLLALGVSMAITAFVSVLAPEGKAAA